MKEKSTSITYSVIEHFSSLGLLLPNWLENLRELFSQLSSRPPELVNSDTLSDLFNKQKTVMIIAHNDDRQIVGMGQIIYTYRATGLVGEIHDVVIDGKYRKMGIGRQIVQNLINNAQSGKHGLVTRIELSSNPNRVGANKLYRSLGFKPRDTNSYRLVL